MKDAQVRRPERSMPIPQTGEKPTALGPTMLNVEDFEPTRFRRTRIFKAAGYQVVEAASAREALAAASRRALSVALVDVHLPDSSGIELCDTLKRLNPQLPVLLISAIGISPEIREAGLAAGAHSYLAEPVPTDTLLQSVGNALTGTAADSHSEVWLITDSRGSILDASPLGMQLLSASMRGLRQRSLLVFFEHDRDGWRAAMTRASRGERIVHSGHLRPKERRPVRVHVEIQKMADGGAPPLLWTFRTAEG
jgi:CheY-like chemotaxis protein